MSMRQPNDTQSLGAAVEVMDTTLRDGEQMQDGSYAPEEKLNIARLLLEDVRVDRVEVANARVSQGEEQAVVRIMEWASAHGYADRVEVLGFVDNGASVEWARRLGVRVLNLLAKGSRRHVEKQLRRNLQEHLRDIAAVAEKAGSRGVRCNIYLEDWSGGMLESPQYVRQMLAGLQGLGFERYMLADTRGLLQPGQVSRMVGALLEEFPGLHFDFHAHNDYGMATANTLAALSAGARGVHCTVNGLGERAGNAPLDEVVVAVHDFLGRPTRVDEKQLHRIAETVEIFSGRRLACNKPITGLNVFTQTAGIHADGDRKANLYGSRLSPERFNRRRRYALGKLSGRASLEYNLKELGIELTPEQIDLVLDRIVSIGDRKETITPEDLPYIIADVLETPHERRFVLRSCVVVSSMGMKPMATVKLAYRPDSAEQYKEYEESALGDGGYDALMRAIRAITSRLGLELPALADYQVSIPSGGRTDALVQCTITWKDHGTLVTKGVNSDQVLAAAEATEKMLNLAAFQKRPAEPEKPSRTPPVKEKARCNA
jgi:D-citramalate synthase